MSFANRPALIGLGTMFVVSFLGMLFHGGFISVVPAVVLGGGIWFALSMQANNRDVKLASDAERSAALAAAPPAGAALLYVYREGFMGRMLGFDVLLDGTALAQLKSPRFARAVVAPGAHTLAAGSSGFAASQNKAGSLAFEARAGETIVVALQVERGMAQNTVTLVREPDSAAAVARLGLIPMVASPAAP